VVVPVCVDFHIHYATRAAKHAFGKEILCWLLWKLISALIEHPSAVKRALAK